MTKPAHRQPPVLRRNPDKPAPVPSPLLARLARARRTSEERRERRRLPEPNSQEWFFEGAPDANR